MAVKKKQSKLRKFIGVFNPTTRKGYMALFVLLFAVVGGGYMLYRSFAYPNIPPSEYRQFTQILEVTSTEGGKVKIWCLGTGGQTAFGTVANCYQQAGNIGTWSAIRKGFYSPVTWKFSPSTGRLKYAPYVEKYQCANNDYYFRGFPVVDTVYGPVSYGQIYRYANNRWEIKWATQSIANGKCSTTGDWMKAIVWW